MFKVNEFQNFTNNTFQNRMFEQIEKFYCLTRRVRQYILLVNKKMILKTPH